VVAIAIPQNACCIRGLNCLAIGGFFGTASGERDGEGEIVARDLHEGGNYFLKREKNSYDDFEAFRGVFRGGLFPTGRVAFFCLVVPRLIVVLFVMMTIL